MTELEERIRAVNEENLNKRISSRVVSTQISFAIRFNYNNNIVNVKLDIIFNFHSIGHVIYFK